MNTANRHLWVTAFLCLIFSSLSFSQSLVDGFFGGKGELSTSLSFTYNSYDTLFVMGDTEVSPIPAHGEIRQRITNLYANYAVTNNFQIIANLPYVIADGGTGNPDPITGNTEFSTFQDLTILGKYKLFSTDMGIGTLSFIGALGFSAPLGYEPNGILGIGNGAFQGHANLGAHFQSNSNIFGTLIGGYDLKGSAENNFSPLVEGDFDVPDAANFTAKVGYAGSRVYGDVWLHGYYTQDGPDIMGAGFVDNFPEVRSRFVSAGANLYVSLVNYLGVVAGFGRLISGDNTGDFTYYTLGLVCNVDKLRQKTTN